MGNSRLFRSNVIDGVGAMNWRKTVRIGLKLDLYFLQFFVQHPAITQHYPTKHGYG